MTRLHIEAKTGFTHDFRLEGEARSDGAARIVGLCNTLLKRFEAEAGQAGSRRLERLDGVRARLALRMQGVMERFLESAPESHSHFYADWAAEKLARLQGAWDEAQEETDNELSALPFMVEALDEAGEPLARGSKALAADIRIIVRNTTISLERLQFKVEIDRTLTVIKVILPLAEAGAAGMDGGTQAGRRQAEAAGIWGVSALVSVARGVMAWWGRTRQTVDVKAPFRRSGYVRALAGIARVGLELSDPSMTSLAAQSLAALREEIVAIEAGNVKNRYLWRLGDYCSLAAALSLAAYCTVRWYCPFYTSCGHSVFSVFRNFFLLTFGSAVGTWLSFSLRRVNLSFLDLATLEEDRLDPRTRIVFTTGLTVVSGLLLWTGAVDVTIGQFSSDFKLTGTHAVLIGLLLGIAERTMSNAIFKRATDFAGAIGGK